MEFAEWDAESLGLIKALEININNLFTQKKSRNGDTLGPVELYDEKEVDHEVLAVLQLEKQVHQEADALPLLLQRALVQSAEWKLASPDCFSVQNLSLL